MGCSIDLTQYKPNNFVAIANDIPHWPLVAIANDIPSWPDVDPMIADYVWEVE